MSTTQHTAAIAVEYRQCPWGDHVGGTKEQLQALGLGVGQVFPSRRGRELVVKDPRGFAVSIQLFDSEKGIFWAQISFPNWPKSPLGLPPWTEAGPGVKKAEFSWGDEYVGTAQALAAAGLVRLDQLPGMPGMPKIRVRILPDSGTPGRVEYVPGLRTIERLSKARSTFRVTVRATVEESERRTTAEHAAREEWEARVQRLPRPARLIDLDLAKLKPRATTSLRLAWSCTSGAPAAVAVAAPRCAPLRLAHSV